MLGVARYTSEPGTLSTEVRRLVSAFVDSVEELIDTQADTNGIAITSCLHMRPPFGICDLVRGAHASSSTEFRTDTPLLGV